MEAAAAAEPDILATKSIPRESIPHLLANLAATDPDGFINSAQKLRYEYPCEIGHSCLSHLATRREGKAFAYALSWVLATRYLDLLVDSNPLAPEETAQAVAVLREQDPHFFVNFTVLLKTCAENDKGRLLGALGLLETLSDYSVLLSVLRGLTTHDDGRVRSKAAKLLCRIRPNKPLVERQLLSTDPRVRANAIEALWFDRSPDSTYVLRVALSDKSHRVVVNALIGLYYQGDGGAMDKLLLLGQHPSQAFREAVIWAFNHLSDARAIPALELLTADSSEIIRLKAKNALESVRRRTEDSSSIAPPV